MKPKNKTAAQPNKTDTPLFETLALADGASGRDPNTNIAMPSDIAVTQAKEWVDENRL